MYSAYLVCVPMIIHFAYIHQVVYDKSKAGRSLGKFTGVSFAWWHIYKWATKQIIKVFSSDFIAQWYHHIWPDKKFHIDKVSHSSNTTYLSYIRLAYPMFRADLTAALARPQLDHRQRTLLTNLKDLCEFFIPVVRLLLGVAVSYCVMFVVNNSMYILHLLYTK